MPLELRFVKNTLRNSNQIVFYLQMAVSIAGYQQDLWSLWQIPQCLEYLSQVRLGRGRFNQHTSRDYFLYVQHHSQ